MSAAMIETCLPRHQGASRGRQSLGRRRTATVTVRPSPRTNFRNQKQLNATSKASASFVIWALLANAASKESQSPHRVRGDGDEGTAISIVAPRCAHTSRWRRYRAQRSGPVPCRCWTIRARQVCASDARIDRAAIWSAMMVTQVPFPSVPFWRAPLRRRARPRIECGATRMTERQFRSINAGLSGPLPRVVPCLTRGLADLPVLLPKTSRPASSAIAGCPNRQAQTSICALSASGGLIGSQAPIHANYAAIMNKTG